jgi:flagellar biogenesis protein FliO
MPTRPLPTYRRTRRAAWLAAVIGLSLAAAAWSSPVGLPSGVPTAGDRATPDSVRTATPPTSGLTRAAADSATFTAAAGAPEMSYLTLMAKLGMGLALVVLLVWGLVFLLKRSGIGQQLATGTGTVRVLERAFLAPNKAVYLVEIGDRILALGIAEQTISCLSEWRAGELQIAPRGQAALPFAEQLRRLLGQRRTGSAAPEDRS